MKVHELIKQLKKFKGNIRVVFKDNNYGGANDVRIVTEELLYIDGMAENAGPTGMHEIVPKTEDPDQGYEEHRLEEAIVIDA